MTAAGRTDCARVQTWLIGKEAVRNAGNLHLFISMTGMSLALSPNW
jgi:hypothetical protein